MAIDKRSSRLGILAVVAVILVSSLGTRLWFLQGVQAESYQASVNASKIREVRLPPERGRIFDADGRVLADNERVLSVTVEWSVLRGNTRLGIFTRRAICGACAVKLMRRSIAAKTRSRMKLSTTKMMAAPA